MALGLFRFLVRDQREQGTPQPDFLCVGMVKCATHWLFDQLLYHPDFWIPPLKEVRYLDQPVPPMDNTLQRLANYRRKSNPKVYDRDLAFLTEAAAIAGQPRDLDKYGALFRFKGKRLSGDISPGYYDLAGVDIAAIVRRFPQLKIVLLVREPVERACSHISMRHRNGHFDTALLEDAAAFSRWFAKSEVRRACFATETARRWKEFAPQSFFRHLLFDDVQAAPADVRAKIIAYLGGNPRKKSGNLAPDFNRKERQSKLTIPLPIREFLRDELADEIRASATLFGGAAQGWPARYGL